MKKVLLSAVLVLFFASVLKADLGNCVVYHAKFYLKSGDTISAYFEYSGYGNGARLNEKGKNDFTNNRGVFRIFKHLQHECRIIKVKVYKNYYIVSPKQLRKNNKEPLRTYGFADSTDIIYLDSSDIKKMDFRSATYTSREWLTSEIIQGPQDMLDTIQHRRYWNCMFYNKGDKTTEAGRQFGWGVVFYNYNAGVNTAELERLILLKFPFDETKLMQTYCKKHRIKNNFLATPQQEQDFEKFRSQQWESLRQWFWKKGIVMVSVHETC